MIWSLMSLKGPCSFSPMRGGKAPDRGEGRWRGAHTSSEEEQRHTLDPQCQTTFFPSSQSLPLRVCVCVNVSCLRTDCSDHLHLIPPSHLCLSPLPQSFSLSHSISYLASSKCLSIFPSIYLICSLLLSPLLLVSFPVIF